MLNLLKTKHDVFKLSIDYAYLCNVLTNPQWLFGHRLTIFKYGVDGVHE